MNNKEFGQQLKEYYESIGISLTDENGNYRHILDILKEQGDYYRRLYKEENNIDVGQTVYVITKRYKSSPYEVIKCTVERKTVKKRKSFSVSGSYSNDYYYNGTFVESSINRNVFLIKDQADYECERLNNK